MTGAPASGVLELRADDLVVRVGGDTTLREVDAALRGAGRRLPLRPWDPDGRTTVAGAIAAGNDGLTARNGWRWRDLLLAARVRLPSGEVVRTGADVVKSVAGFDVAKLWVGPDPLPGRILDATLRIEAIPEASLTFSKAAVPPSEVARTVALCDALHPAPSALVLGGSTGTVPVEHAVGDFTGTVPVEPTVLIEGRAAAVARCRADLAGAGFVEVADAEAHWRVLTARAFAPAPAGLHRRIARCRRSDPLAGFGAERAGDPVADVLRGRVRWLDPAPPPPPDPAVAALLDRLRAAMETPS